VWLYAALRSGERVALHGSGRVRVAYHSHFWWSKNMDEGFGTEVPVENERFTAPWSAWYQIRVDARPGATLCATVE
jgi:hypothetical protein